MRSQYRGLGKNNASQRRKYEGCERTNVHGGAARKLSSTEVEKFFAHVQRVMTKSAEVGPYRLDDEVFQSDPLDKIVDRLEKIERLLWMAENSGT